MNILFVLYGDLNTNTANPISLFAQELAYLGHDCIICYPSPTDEVSFANDKNIFGACSYGYVLKNSNTIFSNGKCADLLHACTPRESVRLFISEYMPKWPTPLVTYLEDNETWISQHHLNASDKDLLAVTNKEISLGIPQGMSDPFLYKEFTGLSDLVLLIQEKLSSEIPSWIPRQIIPWGVDLQFFSPRKAKESYKKNFGINTGEKVIVYHGGLNGFTAPAMRDLCEAVLLINEQGIKCKLIRTGVMPLYFLKELGSASSEVIIDVGVVERSELPEILALADLYVQPGRINPFEDLRLPSKVPEFLSMGKPVLLPNVNIAHLFRNGEDAVILDVGTPKEIAEKCIAIFNNQAHAKTLGINARIFAESNFDLKKQTLALQNAYEKACALFNLENTKRIWAEVASHGFASAYLLRYSLLQYPKLGMSEAHHFAVVPMIENFENRVEAIGDRVDNLVIEILERQSKIDFQDQQIKVKDQQISGLTTDINKIRNSFSWRIIKPLRLLENFVRRGIRTVNALRYLIKANNGLINFLIKFGKIFIKEGPGGLYHRFKQLKSLETNFSGQLFEKIHTPLLPKKTPRYEINRENLDPKAINYYGYIKAESGLGNACRGYIGLLRELGYKVSAINLPCGLSEVEFDTDDQPNDQALFNLIHMNADSMHYFFTKISDSDLKGKINIGLWVTELSAFRPDWFDSFSPLHEVWVPSDFCSEAVAAISPIPVQKIPYLVQAIETSGRLYPRSHFGLPNQGFIYAFMFDCSSFIARKNPFSLVKAFKKLNQDHESLYLALKVNNAHKDPVIFNQLIELIGENKSIILVEQSLNPDELTAFYENIDCYVSPHRSEGFGLTIAEAMLAEVPVIATDYSGSTDFVNINHAYPVKSGFSVIEENHGPYSKGFIWGEPDVEDLLEKMSFVYLNQAEAKEKGRLARKFVLENYSSEAISQLLYQNLNKLES